MPVRFGERDLETYQLWQGAISLLHKGKTKKTQGLGARKEHTMIEKTARQIEE